MDASASPASSLSTESMPWQRAYQLDACGRARDGRAPRKPGERMTVEHERQAGTMTGIALLLP
ncbi:hypothetical protein ABTN40_19580, partial [Acinetobacter baumannii]